MIVACIQNHLAISLKKGETYVAQDKSSNMDRKNISQFSWVFIFVAEQIFYWTYIGGRKKPALSTSMYIPYLTSTLPPSLQIDGDRLSSSPRNDPFYVLTGLVDFLMFGIPAP